MGCQGTRSPGSHDAVAHFRAKPGSLEAWSPRLAPVTPR
jgi:hypothetical protein